MDAKPLSIGKILSERQRFVVPIYQRTYSWTIKRQLDPFLEQVEAKATDRLNGSRSAFSHYMGALLVIPEGAADATEQARRLLALSTALFEDFRLIVITLSKEDDAQVIFQTLNSGGEPLAAMDLVRNDVFHRASRRNEDVEKLMEERWSV